MWSLPLDKFCKMTLFFKLISIVCPQNDDRFSSPIAPLLTQWINEILLFAEDLVCDFLMLPFHKSDKDGKQKRRSSVWRYMDCVEGTNRAR